MKPHEEKTHYTPSGAKGGYLVHAESGDDAARVASGYEHMGPLWASAPEMARALLLLVEHRLCDLATSAFPGDTCASQGVTSPCSTCVARTALAKAGVIP